jgi:hypothetical protein
MLLLNAEEIRRVFTMEDAINSNEEAFVKQSKRQTEVPVRINFDVGDKGITSYMPALIKDAPVTGIKIVSTYHGSPSCPAGSWIRKTRPNTATIKPAITKDMTAAFRKGTFSLRRRTMENITVDRA